MKIRNKETGEIFIVNEKEGKILQRIQRKKPKPRLSVGNLPLDPGGAFPLGAVNKMITDRGQLDPVGNLVKLAQPGMLPKLSAGLELASDPYKRVEAMAANPILSYQRGGSPKDMFEAFVKGGKGQDLGQFGDALRSTGLYPEWASATGGLAATLVPIHKMWSSGVRMLKGVHKGYDKALKKAGGLILKGSDDAVVSVGKHLDKAYAPINKVVVDGTGVLDDIAKLPQNVIDDLQDEIGEEIAKYLEDFNIEKARFLKRKLAELKPTSFGKEAKGLTDRLADKKVNKAYASIKKSMQDTLRKKGFVNDADKLLKADDAFTEASRAAQTIRKAVVDRTLLKATKAGKLAKGIEKVDDVTAREAINILRKASWGSRREIDKAVKMLESYTARQKLIGFGRTMAGAALYGGAAGAVGGRVIGKMGEGVR